MLEVTAWPRCWRCAARFGALLLVTASAAACSAGATPGERLPVPHVIEDSSLRAIVDRSGFTGVMVIRNLADGTERTVFGERADEGLIPASTYKILNSLIALETGVVQDAATVIPWDSTVRARTELNRDLTLAESFRVSAVPHYQELARRIGADRMQRYVDEAGYGNRTISGGLDTFWLTGDLRVSPREQVDLLERLYRDSLPFTAAAMETTRQLMLVERTDSHTLRAKTGWAQPAGGEQIGWWVGWVERGADAYVFAFALTSPGPDDRFGPARQQIAREILAELQILPAS